MDTPLYNIKNLTGNDALYARDFYEYPYKPMYYHFWFNNNIGLEIESEIETCSNNYYKSRKTHQIHSNWIEDNANEEYIKASRLFTIDKNILEFSNCDYKVVYNDNDKCFYVKEMSNQKIYKLDEIDIKFIHKRVYGESTFPHEIKTIKKLADRSIKYNYGIIKFNGFPLNLDIFTCFINNSFDIVNTILQLKNI
jgi:hypothetical protein